MAHAQILTFGYSGHSLDSFLTKLQQHGVEVVVDVRRNPVSRKKGFSKTALSQFLAANGVEYVHQKDLGVPQDLRRELRDGTCELGYYLNAFGAYLDDQTSLLDELYHSAIERRCCLLCVEEHPSECHRSVVADKVISRNGHQVEVIHV